LLRYALFGIFKTATDPERDPRNARMFLRQELPTYWARRQTLIELLRYLATQPDGLPHWERDVRAAQLLLGAIEGDSL
jgi:putative DNA methylase